MNRKAIILLFMSVLLITAIFIIGYSFVNQKFTALLDIKPTGTYTVRVGGQEFNITGVGEIQLTSGRHEVEISNKDFAIYKTTIEVQRNNSNQFSFDVSASKKIPNITQIQGVSQNTISNYKVIFEKAYQNDTWLTMILQNKKDSNDKLMLVANKQADKWVLVIGPNKTFTEAQLANIPQELKNDVQFFSDTNLGEPHEDDYSEDSHND